MSYKTLLFSLSIVALSFSSCTKEGKQGEPGKDGNANVVSSTLTAYASDWQYSEPSWYVNISYPAITQAIVDKGAVLVYMRDSQNNYSQLPLTVFLSPSYSSSIEVASTVGGLTIYWTDSDLTQPDNPGAATFKVVVLAASQMILNPNVDLNDYDAVKRAFEIED